MGWLSSAGRMVCGVGLLVILSLLVPVGAAAKFPAESGGADTPPGVTVTGLGFARADSEAARHAVADARRRAETVAGALDVEIAGVEEVELPELTQFGLPLSCRGHRQRLPGCRPHRFTAAAATVTFAIGGGSSGEGTVRSVYANGTATAPVEPRNRSRSRSIKRAALAVRRALAPEAATLARRNARTAADAARLSLGAIVSVVEAAPYYYGPVFYDSALGSFGPGRFCGIVNRPVVRRNPDTGVPRVVRRVPRRRCFVPSPYSVHLEIRYEAG